MNNESEKVNTIDFDKLVSNNKIVVENNSIFLNDKSKKVVGLEREVEELQNNLLREKEDLENLKKKKSKIETDLNQVKIEKKEVLTVPSVKPNIQKSNVKVKEKVENKIDFAKTIMFFIVAITLFSIPTIFTGLFSMLTTSEEIVSSLINLNQIFSLISYLLGGIMFVKAIFSFFK